MKNPIPAITLLFLLSGCAALTSIAPSLQHCESVRYARQGNRAILQAECTFPIADSLPKMPGF